MKPYILDGQFILGSHAATSGDKPRDFDLPLPLVKFIHSFATRCTLDYCVWSALEFTELSADDGRWTIRLALEDEFARVRREIENSSAQWFRFPQLGLRVGKADALFVLRWFEDGLR